MRGRQGYESKLVVSANNMERAINEERAPDTLFYVEQGNFLASGKRTEREQVLAGGPAEAQRLYKFGGEASGQFSPGKMQPQHLAFLAGFAMGSVSTVAAGTGYLHTITPIQSALDAGRDLPTFSAVQQVGSIFKRCYASMGVDSFSLSFKRDDWVTMSGQLKGTGKTQINLLTEAVAGNSDDATVALSANAVEGADAQARLDSVHEVRFKLDSGGGWLPVHVQSASDATPAVIGITPPDDSGTNAGTYEITYVPAETASLDTGSATSDPVWDAVNKQTTLTDTAAVMTEGEHAGRWLVMTSGTAAGAIFKITTNTVTEFVCSRYDLYAAGVRSADTYKVQQFGWLPIDQAKVSEPPMRTNQIQVIVGGEYDGSDIDGGRRLGDESESLEWSYSNSLSAGFLAGDADYAGVLEKGEVSQSIKLDRRMMDAIYQAMMETVDGIEAEYFAVKVSGEGPEYEDGQTYYWEVIWPKCALESAEPSLSGSKINESTSVSVLSHETYGSVVVKVRNKVATYAA